MIKTKEMQFVVMSPKNLEILHPEDAPFVRKLDGAAISLTISQQYQ